jgi:hypothetical protein
MFQVLIIMPAAAVVTELAAVQLEVTVVEEIHLSQVQQILAAEQVATETNLAVQEL